MSKMKKVLYLEWGHGDNVLLGTGIVLTNQKNKQYCLPFFFCRSYRPASVHATKIDVWAKTSIILLTNCLKLRAPLIFSSLRVLLLLLSLAHRAVTCNSCWKIKQEKIDSARVYFMERASDKYEEKEANADLLCLPKQDEMPRVFVLLVFALPMNGAKHCRIYLTVMCGEIGWLVSPQNRGVSHSSVGTGIIKMSRGVNTFLYPRLVLTWGSET